MIHFENLEAEGYGSLIKHVKFNLDRPGINIMRGATGAGKTNIPSLLTWCLFGITLKGKNTVETWEHLRPEDFKGTMTRVNFVKDGNKYSVIRCISYKKNVLEKTKGGSNLFILENNVLVATERNKTDRQKYIEKILGYSFDLFTNSIVFGQRLKRIIEETGPNKKKMFEEAFEVTFIENAKKKTELDKSKVTDTLRTLTDNFENYDNQLSETLEAYDDAIDFEKSFEVNRKETIQKLTKRKTKILEKSESLNDTLRKLKKDKAKDISDKIEMLKKQIKDKEGIIKILDNLDGQLERMGANIKEQEYALSIIKKDKCPYCKQIIKGKDLKTLTLDLKKKINEMYTESTMIKVRSETAEEELQKGPKLKKLKKELEELQEEAGKVKEKQRRLKQLEKELAEYNDEVKEINDEIKEEKSEKLKIKSPKYLTKIDKLKKKKKKAGRKIKILKKQEDIYQWLIKDPLSNNGLKAYIFDSLLGKVNDKLFDYAELLGFRVEFGIDLESSRKDFYQAIYKGDAVIMYPDLSGGQKQLVDFAVGYAIYKVISSIKPTNLNFYDEPFEGLDVDCIDTISDLITHESRNNSLYLITHHTSFSPVTANTIHFKLDQSGNTIIN